MFDLNTLGNIWISYCNMDISEVSHDDIKEMIKENLWNDEQEHANTMREAVFDALRLTNPQRNTIGQFIDAVLVITG